MTGTLAGPPAVHRLADVTGPADLRGLGPAELAALAAEIRAVLIDSVCRTGGHLGPNLGVVELTLAVHRVFDSPRDAVFWDTGHQTYVHKLLTGRAAEFGTLRRTGGLSGYPSRAESVHDLVENSHASTALAYADGLAAGLALRGEHDRHVVAVVGDGALTGGLSWEALNNLGAAAGRPVVVVLNDNGRSYAPTVGGLGAHLRELRHRPGTGATVFGQLGLGYLGPVDGHDVAALEAALTEARDRRTPTVVHCVTEKGRGYRPAEQHETDRMHAVAPAKAPASVTATPRPSWTGVFSAALQQVAAARPEVVALTAAMLDPTGLTPLAGTDPHRVRDVGIAEQHALTSAAGMAMAGLHPVVAVYATFLNRAFDQLLMDVALHRLPVTLVLDRAGVTGSDGASHNGMWDLSLLGMVPGMRVAAPRDAGTLAELLAEAVADGDGPTALRFPKGTVGPELPALDRLGTADVLHRPAGAPSRVLLVGTGPLAATAVAAAERLATAGVPATVVDPRWLLPVDPALVAAAGTHRLVVTLEDNGVAGGYGDAFCRELRAGGVTTPAQTLGLGQRFLDHGERGELLATAGLDVNGVVHRVLTALGPAQVGRQPKRRARAR
ncbi:1-deoxy-D-xylulose-5-phosphate synthase [Modestobacter sp. VKM Ac-2983]|uniref:1-deoxy-D-xylulose-5-phosphate synthase n=1 Tax=Modestobacter sp. VKM Ac-2983 TaxID=3004137 RepID=UPI0022AB58F9|nr:1-deoxy-D-xylulose-5-phosphate synthase [Modestobacter sp. VKM Ac-2983]MCZ2805407.1 1-deoxy-D-xylulose-5-phosphate synthase [Modestobacter sp. VKM Ac-2983]